MKIRLDQYLVQHGLIQSRERAKAMIMAGVVFVNEQKVDKAGEMIKEDAKVEVRGHDIGYVSRGGLKLEKAMTHFGITLDGKVCMDIGASTGGFTDCMLQNGAVKVYAVDVGYGQLAWSLRTDERVVNMERTNIRYVTPENLGEALDLSVVDVSFSAWMSRLSHCIIFSRWHRRSLRRTPWVSAWSSLSLRLAARKLARTVSCVTRLPTAKCCTMPWATQPPTGSKYAGWISAPSRALRATSST